jgi:transcription elongation factor GreA
MSQNLILTQNGIDKLKEELETLTKVRRKEVAQKIKEAKEQGDLSENAEYAAAKEEQGIIESRIAELEHSIKTAQVVDANDNQHGKITLGAKVTVAINGSKILYEIVGTNEADPMNKKISNESPLGQALMGRKVGDTAQYTTSAGVTKVSIEKVQ